MRRSPLPARPAASGPARLLAAVVALGTALTAFAGSSSAATPTVPAAAGPATAQSATAQSAAAQSAADVTDGLVLRYDLTQTSGTTVTDSSGSGRDGTVMNGGSWTGAGGLSLDGVNDYVKLPNNLMTGLSAITVSTDVFVATDQATPFFIWGLGNPATSNSGTGYLMASGNAFRAAISPTYWNAEKVTAKSPASNLARGVWKTVTYTQTGTTGTLFEDGAQVGQSAAVTTLPSQVGNGVTTGNVLGESNYASDNSLKGKLKNFRIYNRALTPAEVSAISLTDANRLAADTAELSLGDLSGVRSDLTLPTTSAYGSSVAWATSNPARISTTGKVTRPAPGQPPAAVTITATLTRGSSSTTKEFTATVVPDDSDQAKADAAAAALTLVHADDVRGHLTLPTTGANGATVAWSSSVPGTVGDDGLVTRPANGEGNAAVTLTATVTVGSATATRPFALIVREKPQTAAYEGYAFAYFTGNSVAGEKIYFAGSQGNNALQWSELNGGQPKLESTQGTLGLRDPFLIRSPEGDRFFLIATDLSIGRNGNWDAAQRQGSRYLEVWESTDLVTWSDQRHVLVSPPTAGNTWAPEAYWDDTLQSYVVFWASKLFAESDPGHTGNAYNRMLYATTRDFVTFSEAKIWQDRGESRIDSTVIRESGTYYRFTKDEGGGGTGCSDIIQEKSSSLTAVDLPGRAAWTMQDSCIGRDAGTSAVEGPTVFKRNPGDTSGQQYYLFVDEYGGRGYIPLTTADLEAPDWKVPASYRLPASPRHGTVLPVTKAELAKLVNAPDPLEADEDGLVVHYPLTQAGGSTATDATGHGYGATLTGDASFSGGALTLGGTNGHLDLPDNLMAGMDEITVSMDVKMATDQATPYFLWGMGNTGTDGVGNGYLFQTGNAYRSAIASGNWTTEQGASSGADLPRGVWKTITYTQTASGVASAYLDGVRVSQLAGVTTKPGDLGGGRTTANYIGRSVYNGDRYLKGQVRDVRVYARALSAGEVAGLGSNGTSITGATSPDLKVPAIIDTTTGTVTLPVKPGTDVSDLDPQLTTAPGATVTPAGPWDLTAPLTVRVTAAGGATRDWTLRAVQMRSPILPGYNADPNIVRFGDTYYIYATTDGFAGWSSSTFKVWSSKDLVDWTEHDTILDLGPDVSWADTSAWAPAATEKDGKYFFYYSAQQSIGVAVSDSPLGPFTDPLGKPLVDKASYGGAQQIDPAVFTDGDGQSWLLWGNGTARMAKLNADMTSIDTSSIRTISGLTNFREGLFMVERRGTYYLSWSIDDTRSENYRVGYATASSVTGPFTSRGEILTKDVSQGIRGTGHHSMVQVPGGDEWYVVYHRFAIPDGDGTHRETTIDRLTFNADGTIAPVVPTLSSIQPLRYAGAAPTAVVSDRGGAGWSGADAALTVTAEGSSLVQYRLDGGPWTDWSAPVDLPAGSYDVDYRAQSANLLWSEVGTLAVKVDDTVPTTTATVSGRTVTVTAADADSGVAQVEYRVDDGAWSVYDEPLVLDDRARVVQHRATDVAGNRSPAATLQVEVAVDSPEATERPDFGDPAYGSEVVADPGTWNRVGLTFRFQWLRDGKGIPGASRSTYVPKAADVGHQLSVRVTATAGHGVSGVAVSEARLVERATSSVAVEAAPASPTAGQDVVVRVAVGTQPASVGATGKVTVKVDGQVVTTITLDDEGRGQVVLRLAKGAHTVAAVYKGTALVAASGATRTVRVR